MLQNAGAPVSRRREQERARWLLLDRYDTMKPEPNVDALARQIAEGKPNQDVGSIDRQINRALAERKQKLAAGKWRGPGAPPLPIIGGIVRIRTR